MIRVCLPGFGATFAAVFALIYSLREFPLPAVTNCFELRCKSKQLLLLYYKISPRLNFSALNEHKFRHNSECLDPICACGTSKEDNEHFLLH